MGNDISKGSGSRSRSQGRHGSSQHDPTQSAKSWNSSVSDENNNTVDELKTPTSSRRFRMSKNVRRRRSRSESSAYGRDKDIYDIDGTGSSRMRAALFHDAVRNCFDSLHISPVSATLAAGGRVLDVGCGTASWSMAMCALYSSSYVTGVDIQDNLVPTNRPWNFSFVPGALTHLPFPDGTFDLVYARVGVGFVAGEGWVGELMRVTKPGGYIELAECLPPTSSNLLPQFTPTPSLQILLKPLLFVQSTSLPLQISEGTPVYTALEELIATLGCDNESISEGKWLVRIVCGMKSRLI